MPELPEVETLRLQLSQLIIGKTIKSIDILKPKSFIGKKEQVIGKKIVEVKRFAKILVIDLSNGLSLAVHLKMSGQLIFRQDIQLRYIWRHTKVVNDLSNKHTRVIITFVDGDRLYFNDQRMFGWIKVIQNAKFKMQDDNAKLKIPYIYDLIKKLGPEPLRDLTLETFKKILKSSRKPIKLLLMDQEKIAGIGNIYANDALFLAKINPAEKANEIEDGSIVKLFNCLQKVLKDGIKWRGASKNHFRDVFGAKGKVQEHFHAYDREGEKCPNKCGSVIERITLGGRGTFFCPKCQR